MTQWIYTGDWTSKFHSFLTWELYGDEKFTSRWGRFVPGEKVGWGGGWVSPWFLNAAEMRKFACQESTSILRSYIPSPSHYKGWSSSFNRSQFLLYGGWNCQGKADAIQKLFSLRNASCMYNTRAAACALLKGTTCHSLQLSWITHVHDIVLCCRVT